MNTKVLVAYASKYGATKEIAEKIGLVLKDSGFATDVLPADKVNDLGPYKAVILGSAVYIGGWRKGAAFPEKLSAIGRWLMKKVKAPLGDFRNWNVITVWAGTMASKLKELRNA